MSLSVKKYNEEFLDIFPDGVNSPLRMFGEVDTPPLIIKRASGSLIHDIDENLYIDFMNGLGSLILGHAPSIVVEPVKRQLTEGSIYSCCHSTEYEYGKCVSSHDGFIEKLRFVCSGTEAVMGAIRTARAVSGKEKIIRFSGCYHGHSDDVFYRGESNIENWRDVGLISSNVSTLTCTYGDADELIGILESDSDIAAIIIEPVASNMGLKIPTNEFMKRLRSLATKHNALLIFDEVVSGFRFCPGSVSKLFNIEPDLVCFGKIIGGGFSSGCFGGKEKYMNIIEDIPGYFQGGTFAANPVTSVAGIETIKYLSESDAYNKLEELGQLFETSVTSLNDSNFEIRVIRLGSLLTIVPGVYSDEIFIPCHWQNVFSKTYSDFLSEGILLPPSIDEPIFISLAHSKDQIRKSAMKVARILKDYLLS